MRQPIVHVFIAAALMTSMVYAGISHEDDDDIESARMHGGNQVDLPTSELGDQFTNFTAWGLSIMFRAAIVTQLVGFVGLTPRSSLFPRIGNEFTLPQLLTLYVFSKALSQRELVTLPIAVHEALQLTAVGFEGMLVVLLWSALENRLVTPELVRQVTACAAVSFIAAWVDPLRNSPHTVAGAIRSSTERITQIYGYISVVAEILLVTGGVARMAQFSPRIYTLVALGNYALWRARNNPPLV